MFDVVFWFILYKINFFDLFETFFGGGMGGFFGVEIGFGIRRVIVKKGDDIRWVLYYSFYEDIFVFDFLLYML